MCVKNTGLTSAKLIHSGYKTLFYNGTVICNGSSSNLNNNNNINITINTDESCYIYDRAVDFDVNYSYLFNSADQSGFYAGTQEVQSGIIGMVINFFSLAPVLGTIIGILILISIFVIIFVIINKFKENNEEDTIHG